MSEFIGSRISLISKSDIRYVGVLYEINSESSTVALEQVKSFGTEGRRNNPNEEIPGSDSIYEYIVFRGSDVKDLKIEEAPKENKAPQPQVPDDPAILGSGSRPQVQPNHPQPGFGPQASEGPRLHQPPSFRQPPFQPYQQYNQFQNQQFKGPQSPQPGFGGPHNGFQGYPGMPYGAPPGWYPPPGQGFPQPPGPFSPQHQPPVSFGGPRHPPVPSQAGDTRSPPVTASENNKSEGPLPTQELQASTAHQISKGQSETQSQTGSQNEAPPLPPNNSKPDTSAALAPSIPTTDSQASDAAKKAVAASKNQKIVPAVPLTTTASKGTTKNNAAALQSAQQAAGPRTGTPQTSQGEADTATRYQSTTQAATAAVAAAMAKLPPAPCQKPKVADNDSVDNLTKKVNEMRTDDRIRHSGKPGTGGYAAGHRGGRGGRRGGHHNKSLEVPSTDFDFESANAKFNKQELVKEAVGANGSTNGDAAGPVDGDLNEINGSGADVVIPPITETYSKSSFFDNISSEAKDRELAVEGKKRGGGPEFRHEERKKNLETFGMGSVESGGYRGGYRGRGGRGRGSRGGPQRGGGSRGGSGFRNARRGEFGAPNAAAGAASAGG